VAALLRFAGSLHIAGGKIMVEVDLDTGAAARRLRTAIADLFGLTCEFVVVTPTGLRRGTRYVVRLIRDGDSLARQTGLIDSRGRPVRGMPAAVVGGGLDVATAVWRGAFLAHGSLTEPGRSMSMEVTCPGLGGRAGAGRGRPPPRRQRQGARGARSGPGRDPRRGRHRDHADPAGRPRDPAEVGGARMRREIKASANRLANFDDANLRRSARAAVAAGARVERALEILGEDVPEHLRTAGMLRLEHKQASLEELGQLHEPPLTKDAVAGRIRRLLATADKRAADGRDPRHRGESDARHARGRLNPVGRGRRVICWTTIVPAVRPVIFRYDRRRPVLVPSVTRFLSKETHLHDCEGWHQRLRPHRP
jgi:DNA-binding transcriptional regulator WhiA